MRATSRTQARTCTHLPLRFLVAQLVRNPYRSRRQEATTPVAWAPSHCTHTCTLYITAFSEKVQGTQTKATFDDEIEMPQAAWNIQTEDALLEQIFSNVDVDKECLERLEEEIFERYEVC